VQRFAQLPHQVLEVRCADGTEAVLKVCGDDADAMWEVPALRVYGGVGACQVLRHDAERGATLLERVRPGTQLREVARVDDDAATRIGAQLLRTLWSHSGEGFRPLAEWFTGFDRLRARFHGGTGPLPERLVLDAERISKELLDSAPRDVLLHGDFHHFNVLASERDGWIAIDPKGMRGDPGYDVGPFMCNPWQEVDLRVLGRRLAILAEELEYDRERLRLWCFAHAMLSAWWSVDDDSPGWEWTVEVAERLVSMT
jgi:streptomycin 6-kinase